MAHYSESEDEEAFMGNIRELADYAAARDIRLVPAWMTVAGVCLLMGFMVLNGRYWTWAKLALAFCAINLIYIPGAFMVNPTVTSILRHGLIPNFPGGFKASSSYDCLPLDRSFPG